MLVFTGNLYTNLQANEGPIVVNPVELVALCDTVIQQTAMIGLRCGWLATSSS